MYMHLCEHLVNINVISDGNYCTLAYNYEQLIVVAEGDP